MGDVSFRASSSLHSLKTKRKVLFMIHARRPLPVHAGLLHVVSTASVRAINDAKVKEAVKTAHFVTAEEHEAKEQAAKATRKAEGLAKSATTRAANAALRVLAGEAPKGPKSEKQAKPAKAAKVAKPEAPKLSLFEQLKLDIAARIQSPGEAAIRLAACSGTLPANMTEEKALKMWHNSNIVPSGINVPVEFREAARNSSRPVREIASGMATERPSLGENPLVATLRKAVGEILPVKKVGIAAATMAYYASKKEVIPAISANMSADDARKVLASATRGYEPLAVEFKNVQGVQLDFVPDDYVPAINGVYYTSQLLQSPEQLEGQLRTLSQEEADIKRDANEKPVCEMTFGADNSANFLSAAMSYLDDGKVTHCEVLGGCTILTLFYQELSKDDDSIESSVYNANLRAIIGEESLPGIAIRRFIIGEGKAKKGKKGEAAIIPGASASQRAHEKGLKALAEGVNLGKWDAQHELTLLGPGQFIRPVLDETGAQKFDDNGHPLRNRIQKITSFASDPVLRREAVKLQGRGDALPVVESTLSSNGKYADAQCKKPKDYNKGTSWQKGGGAIAAVRLPDYR